MKYIRTKDGIYLFSETHAKGKVIVGKKHEIDFGFCFDKKDVIKESDTIEELCDGFIGVPDKEWFEKNSVATIGVDYFQKPFDLEFGYYKKDFADLNLKNQNGWEYTAMEWQKDNHDFIFGYIETDKGLIYVAKMNEKGGLELYEINGKSQ